MPTIVHKAHKYHGEDFCPLHGYDAVVCEHWPGAIPYCLTCEERSASEDGPNPWGVCSDCPLAGYPTDKTRCAECPRVITPNP